MANKRAINPEWHRRRNSKEFKLDAVRQLELVAGSRQRSSHWNLGWRETGSIKRQGTAAIRRAAARSAGRAHNNPRSANDSTPLPATMK